MGWVGGREAREEGDLSIIMAVLRYCVAETKATLQKKKKKKPFFLNLKKIKKKQGKQCKFVCFFP